MEGGQGDEKEVGGDEGNEMERGYGEGDEKEVEERVKKFRSRVDVILFFWRKRKFGNTKRVGVTIWGPLEIANCKALKCNLRNVSVRELHEVVPER